MRLNGLVLRWLGALGLGLAGCATSTPNLKPPVIPEEYAVPPAEDARYSSPTVYPKGLLNQERRDPGLSGGPKVPPRVGGGPGSGLGSFR
jgi:hypothetical protein